MASQSSASDVASGMGQRSITNRQGDNTEPSPYTLSRRCVGGRDDYYEPVLQNMASINARKNPELNTLPVVLLQLAPIKNPHIHPACIESSLAQVTGGEGSSNRFRACVNNKLINKDLEPCASERYVKMVHHSFELVATCMKAYVADSPNTTIQNDWVESFFTFLTKESGLQVSAISPSDALGVAQTTSDYRSDFIQYSLKDVRKYLAEHKSVYCRSLGDFALSPSRVQGLDNQCNLLSVDSGPLTGFLIGFSHLRRLKREIQSVLDNDKDLLQGLSTKEQNELIRTLVTISYNTGMKGITDPVEFTLNAYRNRGKKVESIEDFLQAVGQNIHLKKSVVKVGRTGSKVVWTNRYQQKTNRAKKKARDSRVLSRADEVANYLRNVKNRSENVLRNARKIYEEDYPNDPKLTSCRRR